MSKILTLVLIMGLVFGLTGCIGPDGNRPPNAPIISCPTEAKINEEVAVTVKSFDPDGDRVALKVRFGDGTDSDWSDYVPSNTPVVFTYKYQEAGDYGIRAVASDEKARGKWSEDRWIKIKTSQPPPQRKMSILWCGDENWGEMAEGISAPAIKTLLREAAQTWEEGGYGGTHVVGFMERFKPDWLEGYKVKLIMYLKTDDLGKIRDEVIKWRNHLNLGGYWFISGHEPDITGTEPSFEGHKKLRREIYQLVRELDPNAWDHPVVIWYNCTGAFADYPGWQNAFQVGDHDVYAADIYANKCIGETDYTGLARAANDLVTIGMSWSPDTQFVPCLGAFVNPGCKAVTPLEQWEWWVEWYRDQTGQELRAVAYYFSGLGSTAEGVYENETLREGVKEINRRLGLLK